MIPVPTATNDVVLQEINIAAPAERIFRAISDPAELLRWWASEGKFRATEVDIDLRPGGAWRMRVEGGCGPDISCTVVKGKYVEVEPPHRLAYTWIREEEDDPETLVRWDLEENGGGTTVRVTHSGFTSERMRLRNSGWPLIQGLLQRYLESRS